MCVIMIANNTRPTEDMIERAWYTNDDGAGFAWREGEGKNTEVVWKKGIMKLEDAMKIAMELPLPYVAHFRIASIGGIKEVLTHPFPISSNASLLLSGRTKGQVLFHNGHWSDWNSKALDAAIHANNKIPSGPWSDTRAMAWLVSIYGPGFMEFMTTQKGVLFGPHSSNVFTGTDGWEKINDVYCSNSHFTRRSRPTTAYQNSGTRICRAHRCNNVTLSGSDLCIKCQQEAKAALAGNASNGNTNSNTNANGNTTGTQGVSTTVSPFAPSGTLSLLEAEVLRKKGVISKSLFNKIREDLQIIAKGSDSKKKKAQKALVRHTQQAKQLLLSGSEG